MDLIISVCGRICAGKSFVADLLAKQYNIPVASFGGFLRYYCKKNGFLTNRKTLQDVGENLIRTNPYGFTIDVIDYFIGKSNSIILEGVRHKIILDIVNQLTNIHLSMFIDVDQKTRYDRYIKRDKKPDTVENYNQFVALDVHPVELEIESLKPLCGIQIDSSKDFSNELFAYISKNI